MYDLSMPNEKPGVCCKCKGSGVYKWGANVNGRMSKEGPCWSCQGSGKQSKKQIRRNIGYNYYKIRQIMQAA